MSDAHERRLLALERRVAMLEEYFKNIDEADIPNSLNGLAKAIIAIRDRLKAHGGFIKDAFVALHAHQQLHDLTDEQLSRTGQRVSDLMGVAYQRYPEAEVRDSGIAEQLDKLKILDEPDAKG